MLQLMRLLLGCLFLLQSGWLFAQSTAVNADVDNVIPLSKQAEILLTDESNLLSDVLRLDEWEPHKNIVAIENSQSLWVRFKVQNRANASRDLTLVAGSTFIDHAEAYVLDEQGRIVQSQRLNQNSSSAADLSRSGFKMAFTSQAQSQFTVYLLIRDDGLTILPMHLWKASEYANQATTRLVLIGAISGGLSLLSLHFLLTYILRNKPARFWFCVFSVGVMTTMLSVEGILPVLFQLPSMAADLTSLSLIVSLFSALKLTRIVFSPMSQLWINLLYVLILAPVIGIIVFSDFLQMIIVLGLTVFILINKLIATALYRKTIDLRSATIYFAGWTALTLFGIFEFFSFIFTSNQTLFAAPYSFAISCLGVMLIGVAIISREQSTHTQQNQVMLKRISLLDQYNDNFQHSVDGLFTAKPNGDLVHVNPAICHLFGYKDETDCLSHVPNLNGFFVNSRDLDFMLGELRIQKIVIGKEVRAQRRDGSEFWLSISSQLYESDNGLLQFGSLFDTTERRLHQINLQYLNTHDQLTGLFNRKHFLQLIEEKMQLESDQPQKFGLIFIDIDQLKLINNSCGHQAGDIFIKDVALELYEVLEDKFPFARLSADQFGVIVDYENSNELRFLAEKMVIRALKYEFKWDKKIFKQYLNVGIAVSEESTTNAEELLLFAENACLLVKEDERDNIRVYTKEIGLNAGYQKELYWAAEVQDALEDNRFELYYQHYRPLNIQDDKNYFELLVRLRTKDNDLIGPEFFMPNAEKSLVSHKIDKIVVEKFFNWLAINQDIVSQIGKANINISSMAVIDEEFRFFLINAFEKYRIPYEKICFEITETTSIVNVREVHSFIEEFKPLGCSFAIDDFGSGFSSYNYLKSLPVDYLKIDGNFIRDLLKDKIDLAMVISIRDVAEALNIKTIAEFVETQELMVQVGKLGVDFAQGLFIAQPSPLEEFTEFAGAIISKQD